MAATGSTSFPVVREAVASFPDRDHFRGAVSALLAAGFEPSDLSVLASHQPLAAAEEEIGRVDRRRAQRRDQIHRAADRRRHRADLRRPDRRDGGGAGRRRARRRRLKELFDDYTAAEHRGEFAAALEAGAALLWVRCADPEIELRALRLLEEAGGRHVHVHGRPEGANRRGEQAG